jgi:hypothetical protein
MMGWYDKDPSNLLVLRWFADDGDPGFGQLFVVASSNGFTGNSSAWFNASELLEFARRLREYPPSENPVSVSSGFRDGQTDEYFDAVAVDVTAVGGRGQIAVRVRLTSVWEDRSAPRYEVRLELLTTYERLRTLADELGRMLAGEIAEVTLGAEELA